MVVVVVVVVVVVIISVWNVLVVGTARGVVLVSVVGCTTVLRCW